MNRINDSHRRYHQAITIVLLCLFLLAAAAQPLFARIVVVQKEQVNVRQGASTSSAVLGKVGKDMIFGWQGASADWTKIRYTNGRQGYIRNDLLQGYDDVEVTGSGVRIRENPSLQAAVLGSVRKGDKLAVSDYESGWFKVSYGESTGWISADYAKLAAPVALSSAASAQLPQADWQAPAVVAHNFDSAIVSANPREGALSGKIITLDPGHGVWIDGRLDPGAQSAVLGIWEKDINLDVTLKLKAILEDAGATVWMTHTGETTLSLSGRAALANQNASHIFVSIHTNSSDNTALNGHSVFFYAPLTDGRLGNQRPLRQALARYVQESLTQSVGRADLGVKESNFVVLRETQCPSLLVETAFMSDPEEELLLAQGFFRQQLAEAIANGIMKYFGAAIPQR